MSINIVISSNIITEEAVNELNSISAEYQYSISKRLGFSSLPPETVLIIVELLKNVEYCAVYDIIKMSILNLVSKLKELKKSSRINIHSDFKIVVICNDKKSEIDLPFEISEEQEDRLVNAAIEKFLRG